MKQNNKIISKTLLSALLIWLFSRLIICLAMLAIAPLLSAPPNGVAATISWDVFYAYDSAFYEKIAIDGYNYSVATKDYSVAFFPLFPLLIRGLISFGLPFKLAAILINNLAFLGTVIILSSWINEHYGMRTALWITAVLTLFPMSLFGTVIYSEGVYLLFSTAALRAFDKKQYAWTALWGAMATAARPTGIALITAFLFTSWRERRKIQAYLASLATGGGLLLYSLYCQIKIGDALVFLRAQKAWRSSLGFDWQDCWKMFLQITIGQINVASGYLKDPWHPLLFVTIVASSYLLWHFRKKLGSVKVDYGFFTLLLLLWLLAGDPFINTVTILGTVYLLWYLRAQLIPVTMIYGFCCMGLIFASGGTISLSRIAYGSVSFSIALGILLSRYPRWGYATLGFFTILLASFSVRFAQNLWVS